MAEKADFDLMTFLPYLLNQAAEASSVEFQSHYKSRYGMLRTEWRVLFHLGLYGEMTAKQICERAGLHKTKVSRAVQALEQKRFLKRDVSELDRRVEALTLTRQGQAAYSDLFEAAKRYDGALCADLTQQEDAILRRCLVKIAQI